MPETPAPTFTSPTWEVWAHFTSQGAAELSRAGSWGPDPHFTVETWRPREAQSTQAVRGRTRLSKGQGNHTRLTRQGSRVTEKPQERGHAPDPDGHEGCRAALVPHPLSAHTHQLTRCLMAAMTFRKSWDGRDCFRNASNFVFDIKMVTIFRP